MFRKLLTLIAVAFGSIALGQVPISGLPPANLPLQPLDQVIVNQTVSGAKTTRSANVSSFTSLAPPISATYLLQSPNGLVPNSRTLTGSTNQVILTDGGALGNLTLSLPQPIGTLNTPTFGGMTLTGGLSGTTSTFSGNITSTNGSLFSNNLLLQGDGTSSFIRNFSGSGSLFFGIGGINYWSINPQGGLNNGVVPTSGTALAVSTNFANPAMALFSTGAATNGAYTINFDNSAGVFAYTGIANSALYLGSSAAGTSVNLVTANTVRAQINSTGNFSILAPPSGTAATINTTGTLFGLDVSTSAATSPSIMLVNGATKGIRFGASTTLASIDGVDNTGVGSFQPLAIQGSTVALNASGTSAGIALGAAGNVTIAAPTSGANLALTGIGNAFPLVIGGPAAAYTGLSINETGQTPITFYQPASSSDARIQTNGQDRIQINSIGNVQVNSPGSGTSALSVFGTTSAFAAFISGANAASGSGLQVVGTFTGSGNTSLVNISDVNNNNGVNIQLSGNGVTTPSKFLRVQGGIFEVINSAYAARSFGLQDNGAAVFGAPTGGFQGAGTINATGLFVNGVATSGTVTSVGSGTGVTASPNPIVGAGTLAVDQAFSPTWTGSHTFSAAPPQVRFNATGAAADQKNTLVRLGASGAYAISSATDAAPTVALTDALVAVRTGAAWTALNFGNATDNPSSTFLGTGGVVIPNGAIRSANGATSAANSTATTMFTFPNANLTNWLVSCNLSTSGDVTNYGASSIVATGGATAKATALQTATLMVISVSGLALQCSQSSGATNTITWSVLRWGT